MPVNTFECLLSIKKSSFRYILEHNLIEGVYVGSEHMTFKEWIIQECFGICFSEFEEQTMVEVLRDEFEDFIREN